MARILFVSPLTMPGGPTYILVKILKYALQQHEIAVVTPDQGELYAELIKLGVTAYVDPAYRLQRWSIFWLWRLIRNEKFDLVYGAGFRSGARNSLIAAKLALRPFVWHINEMLKPKQDVNYRNAIFLRASNAIIADAEASVDAVKQYVPASKPVHMVYNGVDVDEFDLDVRDARRRVRSVLGVADDVTVVLSAGLICERKGQLYSIQAAADVLKDHPKVVFAFLGDMKLRPQYVQLLLSQVHEWGLEDKIRFLGFRKDFPQFIVGSDLLLHTAVRDPHPVVILSAMASKRPVIAFGVDGVQEEVVDGETGFLVERGDVAAVAQALRVCLSDADLRYRMGEQGYLRVQKLFTADEMARQVIEILESHLSQKVNK